MNPFLAVFTPRLVSNASLMLSDAAYPHVSYSKILYAVAP
jgi:hypothetical protein